MNHSLIGILLVSCCLVAGNLTAAESIGMVTGPPTGTQMQFGRDIANVAKSAGLDIEVKESQGSVENIRRMDSQENAALGIVYADLLGYLSRSENPNMRQVASRLRLIFPLYQAETHLLAHKSIQTLADLQGKRVVAGEQGSGTWLTTMNLLQLTNIKPAELLNMSHLDGLAALLKGQADAMFFVVGKPAPLFTKLGSLNEKPEYAAMVGNVHFVPLDDPRLLREYQAARIGPTDYSWMASEVPTVAVKAVLMSFDFSSKQNPYFALRCQQLEQLGQVIRTHIGQLQQTGHPKWKEINLEEQVGIWQPDRCSHSKKQGSGPKLDVKGELEKLILKP